LSDASKTKAVVLGAVRAVDLKITDYTWPFNWVERRYLTGLVIKLRSRDLKEVTFKFEAGLDEKLTTTHFKAERKSPSEWIATEE
jgi:hypothetical protein